MFNKIKNIKFEKINMKLVIAIGIVVILILTAIFILFKTDLVIDKKDKKSNSNSNSVSNSASNSNSNPDPSNSNSNSNPNYEDPDDKQDPNTISEAAKNRTKQATKLNELEKKYIIEENMKTELSADKDSQKECSIKNKDISDGTTVCALVVAGYIDYTNNYDFGYSLSGCSGEVKYTYDPDKKEFNLDFSKVTCKNG
jgi:hypothetical protein